MVVQLVATGEESGTLPAIAGGVVFAALYLPILSLGQAIKGGVR